METKIREILRNYYGEYISELELEYENKIINALSEHDDKLKKQWVTYNQVILELKHNMKNILKVQELQYKLTESDNPKETCIEVLNSIEIRTEELDRLYKKIESFK